MLSSITKATLSRILMIRIMSKALPAGVVVPKITDFIFSFNTLIFKTILYEDKTAKIKSCASVHSMIGVNILPISVLPFALYF